MGIYKRSFINREENYKSSFVINFGERSFVKTKEIYKKIVKGYKFWFYKLLFLNYGDLESYFFVFNTKFRGKETPSYPEN